MPTLARTPQVPPPISPHISRYITPRPPAAMPIARVVAAAPRFTGRRAPGTLYITLAYVRATQGVFAGSEESTVHHTAE